MANTTDLRLRALTYLVGSSRSYLGQLELARDEVAELQRAGQDLSLLERALDGTQVAVQAVNSIGTDLLKQTPDPESESPTRPPSSPAGA